MINFMRYKFLYFALSLAVILPGVVSLFIWGLKPSVDFAGGSLLEVGVGETFVEQVGETTSQVAEIDIKEIQKTGEGTYLLRLNDISEKKKNEILNLYNIRFGEDSVSEVRFESVGPTMGRELLVKT